MKQLRPFDNTQNNANAKYSEYKKKIAQWQWGKQGKGEGEGKKSKKR